MAEGDPGAEVRVRLVVDDEASKASITAIREGFEAIQRQMEGTKHASESVAEGVFKGEAAFEAMKEGAKLVAETIEQAAEFAHHLAEASLEAAEAQEQQERQMADFLILMDRGNHSMEDLRTYTGNVREEFAKFGREAGYSTKDLVATFEKLTQRGAMSSETAKELTMQIAQVGKVIPGGPEALSRGFDMLQRGASSARNPLVQLIATTHLLEGNAQAVAHKMKNMTPEHQMALGEEALKKQADLLEKMGANVPDLAHLRTSFEGTKVAFLEAMGKPALNAILPHLMELKEFLAKNADEIERWGATIGNKVGWLVDSLSDAAEGIYEGVKQNWNQVSDLFVDIFNEWKGMWNYGLSSTDTIKSEFTSLTTNFVHGIERVLRYVTAAAEVFEKMNEDVRYTGQAAAKREFSSAMDLAKGATSPEDMANVDLAIRKYKQLAEAAHNMDPTAEGWSSDAIKKAAEEHQQAADAAYQSAMSGDKSGYDKYLNDAIDQHDEAAEKYAIAIAVQSGAIRQHLADGASNIHGGFEAFKSVIAAQSPELARMLATLMDPTHGQGFKAQPFTNIQHFHGGVHIKQDFKDQDPERVAMVFRRDLAHAADARTGSLIRGVGGI